MKNLFLILTLVCMLPSVGSAQRLKLDVAYIIEGQFTDSIVDIEAHIVTFDRGRPGPIKSDWIDHVKAKVISQNDDETSCVSFTLGEYKPLPDNGLDVPWLKIYINNTSVYSDLSGKDYASSIGIKYLCREVRVNKALFNHYDFFDRPVNADTLPGLRIRIQNLLQPKEMLLEYLVTGAFQSTDINVDAVIVDAYGKILWREDGIVGKVEYYPQDITRKWVTFLLGKSKALPSIIFEENNIFSTDSSNLYLQIFIEKHILHSHLKPRNDYPDSIMGKYSLEELGGNTLNWVGVNGYFSEPRSSPNGVLICIRNRSWIE
ncbi:MAG: hypothetical protein Q8916_00285 [Bacteroidota bacterium]|nr:hypothetical protein [Bacteroidota bacterium]MDP4228824.1 hypothetical protein [Bacteroidota bacterium]MDP4235144.1 hypothetical protein [Bacteroidota bacterium]